MNWRVVKTGIEVFDLLHAYGLGVVMAWASGATLEVRNAGAVYVLKSPQTSLSPASVDILDEILRLPSVQEVQTGEQEQDDAAFATANLDGLLAATLTSPQGIRCFGVTDLLRQQRVEPSAIARGLAKVRDKCEEWKSELRQQMDGASDWMSECSKEYEPSGVRIPLPVPKLEAGMTALMTLDPSLGYAHRGPRSDGSLGRKTNVLIGGTRFASLLAYVGAARFLRTQQVAGKLIHYYVPDAKTLAITPTTTLPRIPWVDEASEHALVSHALTYALTDETSAGRWQGLAYHTLQPQRGQQPISRARGYVDVLWLNGLQQQGRKDMLAFWRLLLHQRRENRPYETDSLVEALLSRRLPAWEEHLLQVARASASQEWKGRHYRVQEVKEVIAFMNQDTPSPLSMILERKEGTLRFGQALRLLCEQNGAFAREVMDDLETVHTRDQLIQVLTRLNHSCTVAAAKSPFLFVPSEADCKFLLEDVDLYSARTIAVLLGLLASLWYPKKDLAPTTEFPAAHKEAPVADYSISQEQKRATRFKLREQIETKGKNEHDDQTATGVYDLSANICTTWQAHSLSTAGTNSSNKVMPRRQLLANNSETDACSGNIAKHHHAVLLAEYLEAAGVALCPACAQRDGRRAAALVNRPEYQSLTVARIVSDCGLCDAHGFLVTAKNVSAKEKEKARQRQTKHSLIEFSFALALPEQRTETTHIMTRIGDSKDDGQMLMKMTARSGVYALALRYRGVGVGMDTEKWQVVVTDEQQRLLRHRAILSALRDGLLSPDGAMTATMLPHLTGLSGMIVVRSTAGRAPMYSALEKDFRVRLEAMRSEDCILYPFETVDEFNQQMNDLIEGSYPCLPPTIHAVPELGIGQEKHNE